MLANDSSLSIHNPLLIYTFLALYGLVTIGIVTYVRTKFRAAMKTLQVLQTEWDTADSRHAGFLGAAQEQISKLTVSAPPVAPAAAHRKASVGNDVRHQVIAMAKTGSGMTEIARACGLQEGEIEVLLGMARLQR